MLNAHIQSFVVSIPDLRSYVMQQLYCGGEIRRGLISKALKPREKGASRLCLALNTVVRLLAQEAQFSFLCLFQGSDSSEIFEYYSVRSILFPRPFGLALLVDKCGALSGRAILAFGPSTIQVLLDNGAEINDKDNRG